MTHLEALVQTSELKTTYLAEVAKSRSHQVDVKYDRDLDTLFILFRSDDPAIVAHFVDNHVALLYAEESLEVVGLQIEGFRLSFLPQHENVARIWRLSDTGERISDMGDIIFYAQKLPRIAKEVAQATKDVLGETGAELVAALEGVAA